MQPGETITPGQPAAPPPEPPVQQAPAPESPVDVPQPQAAEVPIAANIPDSSSPERPTWQFNSDAPSPDQTQQDFHNTGQNITWTASEYVSHEKTVSWFLSAGGATLALAAVIYLVTRELISTVVIAVLGAAFALFAARPPRVLDYALDHHGVQIGDRAYPFELFRSFSVLQEGAMRYILLMPLQRFGIPITVYYDPADENQIIDMLGAILPREDRNPSPVDSLMHKIRF